MASMLPSGEDDVSSSLDESTSELPPPPPDTSFVLAAGLPPIENQQQQHQTTTLLLPAHPRRLWTVSDTKLPVFQSLWPKPKDCKLIYESSASIIAIRIAECLRRHSISVDYDDVAATVQCRTVDQCHFELFLWKIMDGSCVMVECVRISGNPITYHRVKVAIYNAAAALDSGRDC